MLVRNRGRADELTGFGFEDLRGRGGVKFGSS